MMQKIKLISLILVVIFSPMNLYAKKPSKAVGIIYQVERSSIIINDSRFKLLSTVNVYLENRQRGHLTDLQKGDEVLLNLVTINKRQFVDTISIVSEPN